MPFSYDTGLIYLSIGVVLFGAFTMMVLTALPAPRPGEGRLRVIMAALCFGLSVWAMQFIGLLAVRLPVKPSFDPWLTALSAAAGLGFAMAAFITARLYANSPAGLPVGAILLGFGLTVMHFFGVESIAGGLAPSYGFLNVLTATCLAVAGACLTLWFAYIRRGVLLTFLGTLAVGLSMAAMHYGAMDSVRFRPDASIAGFALPQFSEVSMAWTMAVMIYVICSVCLAIYALVQFLGDSQDA